MVESYPYGTIPREGQEGEVSSEVLSGGGIGYMMDNVSNIEWNSLLNHWIQNNSGPNRHELAFLTVFSSQHHWVNNGTGNTLEYLKWQDFGFSPSWMP